MEDTRREREVAQEIIVQHISRHASEALVVLPKTARLIGVSDSSSRALFENHSATCRKARESDVSSIQGTVENNGGWSL